MGIIALCSHVYEECLPHTHAYEEMYASCGNVYAGENNNLHPFLSNGWSLPEGDQPLLMWLKCPYKLHRYTSYSS